MGNAPLPLEWSVVEDDREWQTSQPVSGTAEPAYAGERRLAVLVAALFVLLAAGWGWHTWQTGRRQMAREVTILAHREVQVGEPEQLRWVTPLLSKAADRVWQAQFAPEFADLHQTIQDADTAAQVTVSSHVSGFRDDVALVEVVTRDVGEEQSYRKTRFYRRTDASWRRIDPDPALMGSWQTLETEHFAIHYRPIDANAVTDAAPRLDQLYAKMRQDFGMHAAVVSPKIAIEVVTDDLTVRRNFNYIKRTIIVPSPALLSVPVEMTAATVFSQSVVYPLAALVVLDVVDQYPSDWKAGMAGWQAVVEALRLWELWESDGPLAVGREEVVRWLYQNAQAGSVDARQAVPAGYAQLCRIYHIWSLWPWIMSVPLTCTEVDEHSWSSLPYPVLQLQLNDLPSPESRSRPPVGQLEKQPAGQVVSVDTVIEYIVATYGRDHLPRLIAALGKHTSWQTLIPAVFDVSADEFEAGWQAYLAHQYQ